PTLFTGHERKVSITGEVYFEVMKDPAKPFIVETPSDRITVLGTSFNINSYPNEPHVKTSLLKGSVRINITVLKPGEAYVDGKVINTDIHQDVAWKNGYFNFNKADLPTVLRQLERWYDINVEYEGPVRDRLFKG